MGKFVFRSLVLLSVGFGFGCAVGPIVSHETARTVGESNHELVGGFGMGGLVFKWNAGISENFDLGLHYESFSFGVRAKYAFINNRSGWSMASALGTGTSIGGSHTYVDIIGSYLTGSWEPYGTLRLVHIKTDPVEIGDKEDGVFNFTIDSFEYQYGQAILGTRYWFNPNWLLSLEAGSIFSLSSDLTIESNALVGLALGYRF